VLEPVVLRNGRGVDQPGAVPVVHESFISQYQL
jgi:hypothetical protein